jgi:hypothetical protein
MHIWGPGFPGWNSVLSSGENFEKRFGCDELNLVIASPFYEGHRYSDIKREELLPALCGKTVLYYQYGSCERGICTKEYLSTADIMSFENAFVPLELFDVQAPLFDSIYPAATVEGAKIFTHNPACVNTRYFQPISWRKKNIPVLTLVSKQVNSITHQLTSKLLSGIKSRDFVSETHAYPFPSDLENAARRSFFHRANSDISDLDLSFYPPATASIRAQHEQLQREYSKVLQSSKICILDSTILRGSDRTFFEAMHAGCVIAAEMPFEMEEIFEDVIIQIEKNWSFERIQQVLHDALQDEEDLKRRAAKGIVLAKKHFTCEHKLERALYMMNEHNSGFRGYFMPFGVRLGCHNYLPPFDKVNPWCRTS